MKKERRYYFTMILFMFFCLEGCFCPNKKDVQQHSRYQRTSGSNNGFTTYSDVVKIQNYKNKTITVDSFVKLAFNYIDTVKTDIPIGRVEFIGQKPGGCLPNSHPDNYYEQVKYYLVAVNVSYVSTEKPSELIPQLRGITFWRNQEKYPFFDIDAYDDEGKLQLDSALKSKTPLDNGF